MGKKNNAKAQQQQAVRQDLNSSQLDDDDQPNFDSIMVLENLQNLNTNDLQKLHDNGYCTVQSLELTSLRAIEANPLLKGINEQKFNKIKLAIKEWRGTQTLFKNGNDVLDDRKKVKKITTGSINLDNLLGGGIESKAITEVYGEYRTGKTQLAHTLCVTAQLPRSDRGGAGKVLYIDTEGTFRPERIHPISERFNLDSEKVLEQIYWARAGSVEAQFDLIKEANKLFYEQGPFSLIIVDSIIAQFRVEFQGRGQLADRQQQLGAFMKQLNQLAATYNVAVFITNQVMSDPSGQCPGDFKKPIGGCVLAHSSTIRMSLTKKGGVERAANLVDHPCMKEDATKFVIKNDGIYDTE